MTTPLTQQIETAYKQICTNADMLQKLASDSNNVSLKDEVSSIQISLDEAFRCYKQKALTSNDLSNQVSWFFKTFAFFEELEAAIKNRLQDAKVFSSGALFPDIDMGAIEKYVSSINKLSSRSIFHQRPVGSSQQVEQEQIKVELGQNNQAV